MPANYQSIDKTKVLKSFCKHQCPNCLWCKSSWISYWPRRGYAGVSEKQKQRLQKINLRSLKLWSAPHAAYHCYVKRLQNKMTYLSRTTPKTTDLLRPAQEIISTNLKLILTKRDCPNEITRRVLSLSIRNCGQAINQPDDYSRTYQTPRTFQHHSATHCSTSYFCNRPNEEKDPQRAPVDSKAEAKPSYWCD